MSEQDSTENISNDTIAALKRKIPPKPHSLQERLDRVLVVDNIPEVGPDTMDKLKNVLANRIFSPACETPIHKSDIHIPIITETNKGAGYAFVRFNSPEDAQNALLRINKYSMDKKHTLLLNRWREVDHLSQVPDEYVPLQREPFVPKKNLRWWLMDPSGLDQFVTFYDHLTEIYWAETLRKPSLVHSRENWTERYVQWSTHGSYLATVHHQGVKLWGGEDWDLFGRFQHSSVEQIEFSPCERFLVTLSPLFKDQDDFIIIWNIEKQQKLKRFPGTDRHIRTGPGQKQEKIFKWTHDGQYFGKMIENAINIYDSDTMNLVGDKPFSLPGITAFEWCPTAHYFAAFISSSSENTPSSIVLINAKTREEIYRKSLFSVRSCEIQWQSTGKYLGLRVERLTKSKKATTTSFEVLSTKGKTITTQVIAIEDHVFLWQWEPKGNRFAVIHGPTEGVARVKVSFYQITKINIVHKKTIENKPAKDLFWSPRGNIVIILSGNGSLEFYSAQLDEIIGSSDHYLMTDLQWDPTGRYVCTYVSGLRVKMDNGYVIHTFKGNLIHKVVQDNFYQFIWRPRPPSLLSPEKERELMKNLDVYAEKYQKEDAGNTTVIIDEENLKKQRAIQEYKDILQQHREIYQNQREDRVRIRDGKLSDDEEEYEIIATPIEELIEEEVEPWDGD